MKNVKVIIIFLAKFFNIVPIIKKKKIIKILNIKVLNLRVRIRFAILNNFAIILRLNWYLKYYIKI